MGDGKLKRYATRVEYTDMDEPYSVLDELEIGEWVRYEDVQSLESENARKTEVIEYLLRLNEDGVQHYAVQKFLETGVWP